MNDKFWKNNFKPLFSICNLDLLLTSDSDLDLSQDQTKVLACVSLNI